ncbi:acylneuraminate cytidylyltransferase family protein [bacterium]|nr:MAG: acylneuraminate cytidylyltransferase family protein [bacterium]
MNVLCIIPARGGSKGLKNKNIMPLFGKPLIYYTIRAAKDSKLVNKIVVSTDDEKIAKAAQKYNVQAIKRPVKYATDSAPIELALRHAVEYLKNTEGYFADVIVWLQANIPIRKKGQIDNVVRKLISSKADSAVTVYPVTQFPQWMKRMNKDGFLSPLFKGAVKYRRQDVEQMYLLDGAIVAIRSTVLMKTKDKSGVHVFMGKKVSGVVQELKYTIEVDDKESFDMVKFYFRK